MPWQCLLIATWKSIPQIGYLPQRYSEHARRFRLAQCHLLASTCSVGCRRRGIFAQTRTHWTYTHGLSLASTYDEACTEMGPLNTHFKVNKRHSFDYWITVENFDDFWVSFSVQQVHFVSVSSEKFQYLLLNCSACAFYVRIYTATYFWNWDSVNIVHPNL